MSIKNALCLCFLEEPLRIFEMHDLYEAFQQYYELSDFQRELSPKYPQPRYCNDVRSEVAKLVKVGYVVRVGQNQYCSA